MVWSVIKSVSFGFNEDFDMAIGVHFSATVKTGADQCQQYPVNRPLYDRLPSEFLRLADKPSCVYDQ